MYASCRTSRVSNLVRLAAVLTLVWVSVGGSIGIAAAAPPGSQLWVKRYNGPGDADDFPHSIAVSPHGRRVFVTGYSKGSRSKRDYATVAYATSTGAKLWARRYDGTGNSTDGASAVGVSPDGSTVFVTGSSFGIDTSADLATIAYDASTGASLWVRRFNGAMDRSDGAAALGVSPDGSTVFVTGSVMRTSRNYLTIAYSASTGARLWVARYDGPGNSTDYTTALRVGPDGSTVYVTGSSWGTTGIDYATIAYDASSGEERWVTRHDSSGDSDIAQAVEVTPDGSMVFVTGTATEATAAYDASSGAELWAVPYDGRASDLGVSSDGSIVFVTGTTLGATTAEDYGTVAHDASTGAELWAKAYNGTANGIDNAAALGVSPNGSTVLVTGFSYGSTTYVDYATVAYASDGAQLWVKRYSGPGSGAASSDFATALGVSPDGSAAFVTGASPRTTTSEDYVTVAYGA